MVTTHLRARAAQAGALLAVVAGGVTAAPAVALASPPTVQITKLETEVLSGGTVNLRYEVADTNNGQGRQTPANIRVVSGMQCNGDCGQVTEVGTDGQEFNARLTAPEVRAGEQRSVQVRITATINGESATAEQTVNVKGPDKPETVREISGRIKDQDGKAIADAIVAMQDSAGNSYQTKSDGSGGYSFTSSDDRPIAPGSVTVGAGKVGFESAQVNVPARAGRSVTVPLTLKSKAEPTKSASPSPSASASASPSAAASEEVAGPTTPAAAPATEVDPNTASQSEDSGSSWLFIIIGILLVAAGLGAIVLVWLRRKNGTDPGDDDPTSLPGPGPGVVPPSQGRFHDATRVGAPMGAGGGATDATMIAPLPGGPSMADAPTVLQRPVVDDEFPDPYGAPMPQPGSYAGTQGAGWDDSPAGGGYGGGTQQYGGGNGYSEPTSYGRPQDEGYDGTGYGAAGGATGYGAGPAAGGNAPYSEPTGVYRPGTEHDDAGYNGYDQGGYGAGTQGYGAAPDQGGYQAPGAYPAGGYASEPAEQGGYGAYDNGYGAQQPQQPQPGGNYGGGAYGGGNGYADQAGYDGYQQGDQGGYAQQPGYDQYDEQGDHDQRGGYDPNGRHGGQAPGQRRPADWHNG